MKANGTTAHPFSTPETLRKHLIAAEAWALLSGPFGPMYHPVCNSGNSLANVVYSETQMAALDPRAPEIMSELLDSDGRVDNIQIRATLALWGNALVAMPSEMFQDSDTIFHVNPGAFRATVFSEKDGLSMPIVTVTFAGGMLASTRQGTPYIEQWRHRNLAINMAWLDASRPGWRTIATLAESLDCTEKQLAQMLLFAPTNDMERHDELPGLDPS